MKMIITAVLCIAACAQLMTGCASRNKENSKADTSKAATTENTTTMTERNTEKITTQRGVGERVEEGINDTISGGKDIIDDTLSTAESVVDDIIG